MNNKPAAAAVWSTLRRFTDARVGLGRVGASLPTDEVLAFQMAHARARDAVHLLLDAQALEASLLAEGFSTLQVQSCAKDRETYVRRPDLGRRLSPNSREVLQVSADAPAGRLTVVVADGLSALATMRHALPLLLEFRTRLNGWVLDSVVLATQARVALADEIGALRGAEAVAILLGERPGLSSPDSLGMYMTYAPKLGRMDAERNCISNVRQGGLSYPEAAYRLHYLLHRAREAGRSGISIKDASSWDAGLLLKDT